MNSSKNNDEKAANDNDDELINQDFLSAIAGEPDASSVVSNDANSGGGGASANSAAARLSVDLGGETVIPQKDERIDRGHRRGKTAGSSLVRGLFGESKTRKYAGSGAGLWKSIGDRRVRYASRDSDMNADERRGMMATPLDSTVGAPMARGTRFIKNLRAAADDLVEGDDEDAFEKTGEEASKQMYRLQATTSKNVGCIRKTCMFLYSIVNCGALTDSANDQSFMGLPNPNMWLIDFFYWLFRRGWTTVVTISLVIFYSFVLFFTLLIFLAASIDSDCVRVGGIPFGELPSRSRFYDSFALSWHTFSTVGYGSTYPALSTEHDHEEDKRCAFISFLTSIEALVGVIFAGFVGAIIFAKVTRVTQRASVKFSDPLLIQYGSGVESYSGLNSDTLGVNRTDSENEAHAARVKFQNLVHRAAKKCPFPMLEFRLANELHDSVGGEIIEANVNAVVISESKKSDDEVSTDLAKQIELARKKRNAKDIGAKLRKTTPGKPNNTTSQTSATDSTTRSARSVESSSTADDMSLHSEKSKNTATKSAIQYIQGFNAFAARGLESMGAQKMKIDEADEEHSGSHIVPRMVFSKLELDNSEHPFFKRCWTFRHVIDQNSPLLTVEARDIIMENGGSWPWEWNNPESIRKAIHFNQIVVSFTGVSNISAASVYRQKVYDYIDYVIGYQFVNPLYRGRGGKLMVDLNLLSDVIEQNGGGGEALNVFNN